MKLNEDEKVLLYTAAYMATLCVVVNGLWASGLPQKFKAWGEACERKAKSKIEVMAEKMPSKDNPIKPYTDSAEDYASWQTEPRK